MDHNDVTPPPPSCSSTASMRVPAGGVAASTPISPPAPGCLSSPPASRSRETSWARAALSTVEMAETEVLPHRGKLVPIHTALDLRITLDLTSEDLAEILPHCAPRLRSQIQDRVCEMDRVCTDVYQRCKNDWLQLCASAKASRRASLLSCTTTSPDNTVEGPVTDGLPISVEETVLPCNEPDSTGGSSTVEVQHALSQVSTVWPSAFATPPPVSLGQPGSPPETVVTPLSKDGDSEILASIPSVGQSIHVGDSSHLVPTRDVASQTVSVEETPPSTEITNTTRVAAARVPNIVERSTQTCNWPNAGKFSNDMPCAGTPPEHLVVPWARATAHPVLAGGPHTGPVNLPPACECPASDSDTKPPLQRTDSDDPAPEPGRSLEEEDDSTISLYASFDPGGITRVAADAPGLIRHRRSMVRMGKWFTSHRPHPSASQLRRWSHRTNRGR
jgi:hypothetical protein